MFINSIRSRKCFLAQCVRPAALMVPDHSRNSIDDGDDDADADSASEDRPSTPLAPHTPHYDSAFPNRRSAARPTPLTSPRTRSRTPHASSSSSHSSQGHVTAPGTPAAVSSAQIFMPLGFRERRCQLVVKDSSSFDERLPSTRCLSLPNCRIVQMELLVRSALRESSGFWGSSGVAAVCAALRHTPPAYQHGGRSAAAAAPGGGAAPGTVPGGLGVGGAGGSVPGAPAGYQEMHCVLLVADEGGMDSASPELPAW